MLFQIGKVIVSEFLPGVTVYGNWDQQEDQ